MLTPINLCQVISIDCGLVKRLFIFLIMILTTASAYCQEKPITTMPPVYYSLKTDDERMQFIVKTINDSLRGDGLKHVYDWAKTGLALAEKNNVDSLKGSFCMYIGKAYNYYYEKLDSAIFFYKKAGTFFTNPMNEDYAISVRSIMDNYAELGEKDSCFKYLDSSLAIMRGLPDTSYTKHRLAEVIGTNYSWFGMYKSAIRLFEYAKNGYLRKNNMQGVGMVLSHTAMVHDELEETEAAIDYWKQSLPFLKGFKRPYATNCSNIAAGYYNLSLYDSSLSYLNESNGLAQQSGMNNLLSINKKINAEILTQKKQYPQARQFLNECLSYFRENEDPRNIVLTLYAISNLDSATGNIPSAIKNLNEGLEISHKAGLTSMELKALRGLSLLSANRKDYKQAWEYQQSAEWAYDSLTKEKTKTDLADFEILYKTQEKERQIELLKKDNSIKELQLQSSRQQMLLYILLLSAAIIILLILFYQRGLRQKVMAQKAKAELQTQILRSQMNPHFILIV